MIIKSTKENNKKLYVFLIVSALAAFLAASSVLPFISGAKGMRAPDVLLCFVCTLPFFTDRKTAGIFAVSIGFLADLFITAPISLSPVIFLACVCVVPLTARLFSRTGTLMIAICTLPCIMMRTVFGIAMSLIFVDGASFAKAVGDYSLLSIVFDFACAICVAFIMRFVSKRLKIQSYI